MVTFALWLRHAPHLTLAWIGLQKKPIHEAFGESFNWRNQTIITLRAIFARTRSELSQHIAIDFKISIERQKYGTLL